MSFVELHNDFCENIQSHILKRVSNILYRNPVQVFGGLLQFQLMSITNDTCMQRMLYIYQQTRFYVPMIELYVEFEQHMGMDAVGDDVNVDELVDIDWEEDNNDSDEEFEANYEIDDENDDGDLAGNPAVQNEAHAIVSQHPFGIPSFMQTLDLEAMHVSKFLEYANIGEGNIAAVDGEFSVGMKFGSRESVISAIKSYTTSRGVDYTVYESEPQTFYAKCKDYGAGLIRKKGCWEIRRYNDKHTCTMGTISQDHAKHNCRPLVEKNPSIKVKSIIGEVQSRLNYTVFEFVVMVLFIVERLPCCHVLACCTNQHLDWQVYMHDVYKMSKICKVYGGEFVLGDPSTWARYEGVKVIANWTLWCTTKGRPKSTRYLNEMDSWDMCGPRPLVCKLFYVFAQFIYACGKH
ncbi:hypothetical protein Ahy_A08g037782 [Arachis hypogaea]|uniref:Transposase MuDR plant domain-containing protein n=1 Tax=Arachis hypogaea TaxID=3818 RepID=A0A445BRW6_ARAHY|nr:hypothetical protein Ahy_A08g037782 [Arachis hypogaea]